MGLLCGLLGAAFNALNIQVSELEGDAPVAGDGMEMEGTKPKQLFEVYNISVTTVTVK